MRAVRRYEVMCEALDGATLTFILGNGDEIGPVAATYTEQRDFHVRVRGAIHPGDGKAIEHVTGVRIRYSTGATDAFPITLDNPDVPRANVHVEFTLDGTNPDWEQARFQSPQTRRKGRVSA